VRVRWVEFGGPRPWLACKGAWVDGQVLRIVVDDTLTRIIPLHVVRGAIEIEETP